MRTNLIFNDDLLLLAFPPPGCLCVSRGVHIVVQQHMHFGSDASMCTHRAVCAVFGGWEVGVENALSELSVMLTLHVRTFRGSTVTII